jgi:hypothetical protein
LVDERVQTLFAFADSYVNPWVVVDLGSDFITGLDRIIIPANHNIINLLVADADSDSMSGYVTRLTATAVTPGTPIDLTFNSSVSGKRYIGVRFNGENLYYLPQLFFTKTETLTVGPDLANSADGYRANVTRLIQNTGLAPTVLHGPQQRVMEYNYAPIEGDDLATMEALIAYAGMDKPFFVDPASFSETPAADDPPIRMKFDDMPESRHTVLVPMSNAESKAFSLRLIESLD